MISILLSADWDIALDSSGNIPTTSGIHAMEQDVACVCRVFKGEQYYNVPEGIPYWEEILGHYPPKSLMVARYNACAKTVPGVVRVNTVIDKISDRRVQGQIRFTDKKGRNMVTPL